VPDEYDIINRPDILIVEGVNVLQSPPNEQIYISDFFDFNFYIDANPSLIEKWYLKRFGMLLDNPSNNPDNPFNQLKQWDRKEALVYAKNVWENVNLKNLREFILPTRSRADLILHKTNNHFIDQILIKKH